MSEYEERAEKFCQETGTTISVTPLHLVDDIEYEKQFGKRLVRQKSLVTITRFCVAKNVVHSFEYTGPGWIRETPDHEDFSIKATREKAKKRKVSAYDILACLQKCEPGTRANFCSDFGYDTDSRKGLETYLAVQEEYEKVVALFGDVMEKLQEIQ